jgi:broad-specificity NMP kinase
VSIEPRRVEIVGVAGTGKSTLARALAGRYPVSTIADFVHTRSPAHWRYVAHGAPGTLALLARTTRRRPVLSWDEVKLVLYVSEWSRYLDARDEHRSGITLLDQGPLFALACLLWGGNPATEQPRFRAWVAKWAERWSRELDLVVWLEASDDALLERINVRGQRHEAKGKSTDAAVELLEGHRAAYRRVLEEIDRHGHPAVHHVDTTARTPDEVADEVGALLEESEWLTDRGRVLNVG